VNVFVPELGNALGQPSAFFVTQPLTIDSVTPLITSAAGGQVVTVTGSGFPSNPNNLVVLVGGNSSVVLASSYSTITFVTPALRVPTSPSNPSIVANLIVNVTRNSDLSSVVSQNQITYSHVASPFLTSISPTSGWAGTVLTIKGNNFGVGTAGLTVTIGGSACLVNAALLTTTSITCTVGDSGAGSHPVYVTRAGTGTALNATSFKFLSLLQVTGVTAATSLDFGGGDLVSITGRGFGARNLNGSGIGSIVSVCNTSCLVLSSTYTNIQCLTSPFYTRTSIQALKNVPATVLSGVAVTSGLSAAFDDQFTTWYSGSGSICSFTYDLGSATNALLTQIRVFPRISTAALMLNGIFAVSVDGIVFTTVVTITKTPNEGWNSYSLAVPTETRYVRYTTGAVNTYCQVSELQFIGHAFQVATLSTASTSSCTVNIGTLRTPPDASQGRWPSNATWLPILQSNKYQVVDSSNSIAAAVAPTLLTFDLSKTPVVTGVSPLYGSSLGGTVLTIQLTQVPAGVTTIVHVNGYPCNVLSVAPTSLTCTTTARGVVWYNNNIIVGFAHPSQPGVIIQQCQVNLGVEFLYLDKWSELSTWDNENLPEEGDSVVIPSGQSILMDVSPPPLFALFVRGLLVFDRKDLTLDAYYIWVSGGTMQIGTESEPFLQKATILFMGIVIPQLSSQILDQRFFACLMPRSPRRSLALEPMCPQNNVVSWISMDALDWQCGPSLPSLLLPEPRLLLRTML